MAQLNAHILCSFLKKEVAVHCIKYLLEKHELPVFPHIAQAASFVKCT